MSSYEVPQPILNSPYEEPVRHWHIAEGEPADTKRSKREVGEMMRLYLDRNLVDGLMNLAEKYQAASDQRYTHFLLMAAS